MRQKVFIFLALAALVVLLVGLNAASYVEREKTPDIESNPNRSTYNAGATGTRALYELLAETGRRAARWEQPPSALSTAVSGNNNPSTFVVVGTTRREFTDKEIEQLLAWVAAGGRLVIIDREPPTELVKTTANWNISVSAASSQTLFGDSSNQKQMTEKIRAAKPVEPTVFTRGVNAVQPSRFASGISFEHFYDEPAPESASGKVIAGTSIAPPKATNANQNTSSKQSVDFPAANEQETQPDAATDDENEFVESPAQTAPVVHLANDEKNLLVDFPFGSGEIVFLSDPYIVSNGGINLVDNAQLAVNILTARDGIIAFDEYHQSLGAGGNRIFEYFAGTPVAALLLQAALLTAFVFLAQSLRFARALPVAAPNRLSKLEYVSAMAELQQRTKAFDLAIENIYTDFRLRAARSLGADNYAVTLAELARLIAERTGENAGAIESLMFKCEEIVRGERTNKREVLQLASRLREIEAKLGLQRRKRSRDDA